MRKSALKLTVLSVTAAVSLTSFAAHSDGMSAAVDRALGKAFAQSQNKSPKRIEIEGRISAGYNTANKEVEVRDMSIIVGARISKRVFALLDVDGRGAFAKDKVKEELNKNEELRASVEQGLKAAIAAKLHIPIQYVTVPKALLDSTVATVVDKAITDDAVVESTLRQAYVSITALQGNQDGDGKVVITTGKVDPIYYNPDANGHFATASPTVKISYEYADWNVYVSASNNRFGEDWNIDGTVTGQVSNILQKASQGGNILDYDLNSYELAVEKEASVLGRLIVATGARKEGELEGDSKYLLVRVDPKLGKFRLSITGSAEDFTETSKEAPDGQRYRVSALVSRDLGEKTRIWLQAYAGKQTGLVKKDQKAILVGADRSLFTYRRANTAVRTTLFNAEESTVKGTKRNRGAFVGFVVRF